MLRTHVVFTWSAVQFNRNLKSLMRAVEVCVAAFGDRVRAFGLDVSSLTWMIVNISRDFYHSFQSVLFSGTIIFPNKIHVARFDQICRVSRTINMTSSSTAARRLTKENISYLEHLCTQPPPIITTAPEFTALPIHLWLLLVLLL